MPHSRSCTRAPGDELEAVRDGVRGRSRPTGRAGRVPDGQLRRACARSSRRCSKRHRVRVVHPVAVETTILRIDGDGVVRSRRRSPVRGCHLSVFEELVSLPVLATHPSLTFEVVLVRVEEHRVDAPRTRRRRKPWRVVDRVLVEVLEARTFGGAAGLGQVLPDGLADRFTTLDLSLAFGCRATSRSGSPTRCGWPG